MSVWEDMAANDTIHTDGDIQRAKLEAGADKAARQRKAARAAAQRVLNPHGSKKVLLPTIFVWEDKKNGNICGSFRWKGRLWGLCFPYEESRSRREIDKRHLRTRLRDTLDVLVHHGETEGVVDKRGNINERKVHDAEANRFWQDPLWRKRVLAFRRAVLFKEISKERAEKMSLL